VNQYHSPIVRRQGGGIWQKVERSFLLTLVLLFVMLCVLTVSIPLRVGGVFPQGYPYDSVKGENLVSIPRRVGGVFPLLYNKLHI
jgi:hypothetical protein